VAVSYLAVAAILLACARFAEVAPLAAEVGHGAAAEAAE